MKTTPCNNENYDLTLDEYETIVDKVEQTIDEGCLFRETRDWLTLWKQLHQLELYAMTDMFDELMVYKDMMLYNKNCHPILKDFDI